MTRVCFVAYHAYPAIEPRVGGTFGGTETRAWELARGLAKYSDCDVRFVVRRPERLLRDEYDGVRLVRRRGRIADLWIRVAGDVRRLDRFPFLKVRRFRPGLLWQVPFLGTLWLLRRPPVVPPKPDRFFARLDADVFCVFGVHRDSATAIATAAATGRRSVLMLGSDFDLDERFAAGSTYVTPYGERGDVCHYALTCADIIVAQTPRQRDLLRERFGRDAAVLPNPIDVPAWEAAIRSAESLPEAAGLDRYALWIGRADAFHKRPRLCLDLARRCPEVPFLMVLNPRDVEIEDEIRRTAPPNVRIVGRLAYDRMPAAFARAVAFVSTSAAEYEGFPNVFLQAAAAGVPIASLEVAPDFLRDSGGGVYAGGRLDDLAAYLRQVRTDDARGTADGRRGHRYVAEHHDLAAISRRLADLLAAPV